MGPYDDFRIDVPFEHGRIMAEPLKILFIGHTEGDLKQLSDLLRGADFDVIVKNITTFEELEREPLKDEWEIILGRYKFQDADVKDVIKIVKEKGVEAPFIVIAEDAAAEAAAEIFDAGASDVVTKRNLAYIIPVIKKELQEVQKKKVLRKEADEALFKVALLEAQANTAIDGILVVDRNGKTVLTNRRFAEMWNIPGELLETKDDKKIMRHVLGQLKDSAGFEKDVEYLYSHPGEISRDELIFRDGRVFDRYTSPLEDKDGRYYGRIWYFRDVTEREEAKKKLQASGERFKELFDSMLNCVVVYEAVNGGGDFVISNFNRAAERTEKISRKDVIGKNISDVFPGAVKFGIVDILRSVWVTGKPEHIRDSFYEDERISGWRDNQIYKLSSGEVVAVYEDTTVKKLNLDTQSIIKSLLELALEDISIDEFLKRTLDMIFSFHSFSFERKGAIFLAEPGGNSLVMKVKKDIPEDLENLCSKVEFGRCLCGRAASTKQIIFSSHMDERHETRYENMKSHGHYCVPIMSAGRLLGVINLYLKEGYAHRKEDEDFLASIANTVAGVIERKHAEEELKIHRVHLEELVIRRSAELSKTKDRLQFLISSTPVVIYSAAISGNYRTTYISDTVREQLGYEPREFLDDPDFWVNHIHPDDAERILGEFGRLLAEKTLSHEYRFLLKKGGYRWVMDKLNLVQDENGGPKEIVGYLIDIDARKHAEDEAVKLNNELDRHLKDAIAANNELDSFSYSVSHDLRSPLRAIDGFTKILFDENQEKFDAEGKRIVDIIRENTGRMSELIDDLLDFARLSRLPLNSAPTDIDGMVTAIFSELNARYPGREIQLVKGTLPKIYADPKLLRHVLGNLIDNALKFTRHKKPAVIEIGYTKDDGEIIYFVKDNGAGFDMKYADKLFGVFQRLHTAEQFEGTGVGLAIVQRIINRHGGRVWINSRKDDGATVYFTIPAPAKK